MNGPDRGFGSVTVVGGVVRVRDKVDQKIGKILAADNVNQVLFEG